MSNATITIDNVWATVDTDATTLAALDREFAAYVKGYERTWLFKSRRWDGKRHFITGGKFRSGLFVRVRQYLVDAQVTLVVDDQRQPPTNLQAGSRYIPSLDDNPTPGQDWSHQCVAVEAAARAGQGVIYDATGTGKCLVPGTRVLTADLRWVLIEALNVGDELVGFDETSSQHHPRRLIPSTVRQTGRATLQCYEITLATGERLTATAEHKWLVADNSAQHRISWRTTEQILWSYTHKCRKYPVRLPRYFLPWDTENTRESGYLQGLFDGEGSIRRRAEYGGTFNGVSFSQKNPGVLADAEEGLTSAGYRYLKRLAAGGVYDLDLDTFEGINLLGRARPRRLLEKWLTLKWPRLSSRSYVDIVDVKPVGAREVVTITTSTKTFIAEGFATHNTEIMARLAKYLGLKTLFLCDQKGIAQQSAERFINRLELKTKDVGLWASGKHTDGRIVCGTFQSFSSAIKNMTPKLRTWLESFDVLFIDETHHLTGETYQAVVDAVPAYYRFGFSATPFRIVKGRNDPLTELHVVGSTGEVIHEFDAQDGIKAGILTPPHITMFNWHEDPAVGKQVWPRHDWERSDFTIDDDAFEYGNRKSKRVKGTMLAGLYTTGVINEQERNQAVVDAAALFVQDGLTTLLLLDKVPHGYALRTMVRQELGRNDIEFIHGTTSDVDRVTALTRLANGDVPILLANVIADEGLDIPAISAMVLAGGQKAGHKYLQRIGRGMRLMKGKKVLEVVDLFDTHSKTLWLQSLSRLKTYKDAGHTVEVV